MELLDKLDETSRAEVFTCYSVVEFSFSDRCVVKSQQLFRILQVPLNMADVFTVGSLSVRILEELGERWVHSLKQPRNVVKCEYETLNVSLLTEQADFDQDVTEVFVFVVDAFMQD